MKINILDSSVFNMIAAGEVVENPASIVKELVENSLDAGANSITVKIEDGGIKSIEVIDDGMGIPKEELYKTILPHATSKINTAADLDSIATLGFRGEALASIASISDVEIRSKYYKSEIAGQLTVTNGNVKIGDCAFFQGTSIRITNLFYNTPVRFKFLKSPKVEGNNIETLMVQMILSNPNTSFKLFNDGRLVYSSTGGGLYEAVCSVYNVDIYENMIEVLPSRDDEERVKVFGFISKPELTRANRSLQTFIVNGRIVNSQTITNVLQNAYGERLMHRCFPVSVICILMPFDEVDINVHPNKKEVRFADSRYVFGRVYRAVLDTLTKNDDEQRKTFLSALHNVETPFDGNNSIINYLKNENTHSDMSATENIKIPVMHAADNVNLPQEKATFNQNENNFEASKTGNKNEVFDKKSLLNDNSCMTNGDYDNNFKVVGQMFETYLIIESASDMIIIDQHAAHERLLYDELLKEVDKSVVSQPLLIPFACDVNEEAKEVIMKYFKQLEALGFELEIVDKCININSVPALLSDINLDTFLNGLVGLKDERELKASNVIKEKLMQTACKAAIKKGMVLSNTQIKYMVKYFTNNDVPLKCPHGRPVFLTFSKTEIEKLFRRKL